MNSKNITPFHTHQFIIFVLIFIIVLVATAWIYNYEVKNYMDDAHTGEQSAEEIYGSKVRLTEKDVSGLEAIYGNQ